MKQSSRNRPMGRHTRFNNNRHSNYTITRNTTFDSSSPAGRMHGNSQQLIDKYLSLAKDARNQDDRVMYETYLQYADHYTRLLDLAMQNEQARAAANAAVLPPMAQTVEEPILSDEVKEQAEQALAQATEIINTTVSAEEQSLQAEKNTLHQKNNHFRRPRGQKAHQDVQRQELQQPVTIQEEKVVEEIPVEAAPQPVVIEIPD